MPSSENNPIIADPKSVGLSIERLRQIKVANQRHIRPNQLAGTVSLVARHGQVAYFEAEGQLSKETGQAMPLDAIFRIYSMTKPVVCTAMMMLVERGQVRLSDPVSAYIPKFQDLKVYAGGSGEQMTYAALERPITVRDLFTHTSGLTYHFLEDSPVEALYRDRPLPGNFTLEQFIDGLLELPLAFQPGDRLRYSLAHDALGRLIEVISADALDIFLQRELFEPLGMVDTAFYVPESKWDCFASMYGTFDITGPQNSLSVMYNQVEANTGLIEAPHDFPFRKPHQGLRGGTGLTSTALDYWRFCQMLIDDGLANGERLVSRKSIELMRSNHLPPELLPYEVGGVYSPGYGFGLGMRVMMDVGASGTLGTVGEYGWGGAASTYFLIDPLESLVAIYMTQFQPSGYYTTAADFRVAVYQALI